MMIMSKSEKQKDLVSQFIALAMEYDARGDVVNRQVWLRSLEDVGVAEAYKHAALDAAGLRKCYKG
jgi:hypothetical protein